MVALGIGVDGTKHPLGLAEGDTENTTVVRDLLADLRDRGLDTTRPILAFGFARFRNYRVRVLLHAGRPYWDLLATVTPD